MSDTVIKTVENVDQLFSEIVVNGESHVSDRYVPPEPRVNITPVVQEETPQEVSTPSAQETQGADVYSVELNDVLHDFVDRDVTQGLANEIQNRQNADTALQGSINNINAKIPAQASSSNQLADKDFVNSSIATNTANFMGTFTSLADIEAIPNPTNNDYAFLETTDSAGNTLYDRYKYSADGDEWLFEYELNNSGFTAEQWATINSGLTQQSVDQDIADAISALGITPQGIFDTAHPVGEIYIQYPQQLDPNTLYNSANVSCTWTLQTQYDGAFFRASGTNAQTFITENDTLTAQGQATAKNGLSLSSTLSVGNASSGGTSNVTGAMSGNSSGTAKFKAYGGDPSVMSTSGNISKNNPSREGSVGGTSATTAQQNTITVNVAHTHAVYLRGSVTLGDGDTETRPVNFTVQIWKRTA